MNRFVIALLAGVAGVSLVSAASAADLIIEEPAPEVGVVDLGGNWDGVYIGGFAGWAGGETGEDYVEDIDGWLAGVALGANFTLTDGIVAGVVGDIAWSDIADEFDNFSIDWQGSLRGKLGFDGGAFLPYLTAGLAFANAHFDGTDVSNTHIGWTVGAGVEFAATEDLSVDLLYRYSDFGSQDYNGGDISATTHQVTVGLNWHF